MGLARHGVHDLHRAHYPVNSASSQDVLATRLLRISKSAWYDGVRRNVFPQPVRIGTRTVLWLESDIEHYLQQNYGGLGKSAA